MFSPEPAVKIVVTMHDTPYDPFMGAMEQLKGAMLCWYAKEAGLEAERVFAKEHFSYYVVECDWNHGYDLVNHLARRGCVDIHVYMGDDETGAGLIEEVHRGLFRVCRCQFKR